MQAGQPVALEYTSRHGYFTAQASIRDVYDALVELITNSDDSYGQEPKQEGTICVEVERGWHGSVIRVKDRAKGLSLDEMQRKIRKVGDRTSAPGDRGFMARGAKDCHVLGKLTFESIKDDKYHKCVVTPDSRFIPYQPSRSATQADRKNLGIPRGNGTVVILETNEGVKVPQFETLVRQIPRHSAVRDIFAKSSLVKGSICSLNGREKTTELLLFDPPVAEKVVDEEYEVEGYPTKAHVELFRTEDLMDNSGDKRFRPAGILVKGKRAIHELSFLTSEFEQDTYATRYYGKVTCEYIDDLCDQFDYNRSKSIPYPPENPSLSIDPSRQAGLRRDHPFTEKLFRFPIERLRVLIAKDRETERQKRRQIIDETTRQQLKLLARAASRFMKEQLEEQLEVPAGGEIDLESFHKTGVIIIPGSVKLAVGEEKTFTFRARRTDGVSLDEVARVTADSDALKVLVPGFRLSVSRTNEKILTGNFKVEAQRAAECVCVSVKYNGLPKADALVQVVESVSPMEIQNGFAFEREEYRVREGNKKSLILRARYPEVVAREIPVQVVSSSEQIVILGPQCKLVPIGGTDYAEGKVVIQGRRLHAAATLEASVNGRTAITKAKVVQKDEEPGPSIEIDIVDEDFGSYRAKWDRPTRPNWLLISGRHDAMKRYLGPSPFHGQHSPMSKILLAEIVAENVARKILEERAQIPGEFEDGNVNFFYAQHNKLMKEFTPIAHRIQLSDEVLKRANQQLVAGATEEYASQESGGDPNGPA